MNVTPCSPNIGEVPKIPDDTTTALGPYVGVYLYLEGGASGLSASSITISIDLVGRDA